MRARLGSRRRGVWTPLAVVGLFLGLPIGWAQAHNAFPGAGDLASGFLHPLTTPPHLLILLALGLSIGRQVPLRIKEPALVFTAAAAAGLGWTSATHGGGVALPVLVTVGLCVGGSVAVGIRMPLWGTVTACGVAGLLLALDSGVDPGTPGASAAKILIATWASLTLCLVNTAFYLSLLPRAPWVQIGLRVVGSWIVAIALLLLAFALRR